MSRMLIEEGEKVEFDQTEALCCEGLTAESKHRGEAGITKLRDGWISAVII